MLHSLKKFVNKNNLGKDGELAFANAIKENTTMEELALSLNSSVDEGARRFFLSVRTKSENHPLLTLITNGLNSRLRTFANNMVA